MAPSPQVPADDNQDEEYDIIDPNDNDVQQTVLAKINLDMDNMDEDDTAPITEKEI